MDPLWLMEEPFAVAMENELLMGVKKRENVRRAMQLAES